MHKFEMDLRTKIRKQIMSYELTTYTYVVNKALIIKKEANEEVRRSEIDQMILKDRVIKILRARIRGQRVTTLSHLIALDILGMVKLMLILNVIGSLVFVLNVAK